MQQARRARAFRKANSHSYLAPPPPHLQRRPEDKRIGVAARRRHARAHQPLRCHRERAPVEPPRQRRPAGQQARLARRVGGGAARQTRVCMRLRAGRVRQRRAGGVERRQQPRRGPRGGRGGAGDDGEQVERQLGCLGPQRVELVQKAWRARRRQEVRRLPERRRRREAARQQLRGNPRLERLLGGRLDRFWCGAGRRGVHAYDAAEVQAADCGARRGLRRGAHACCGGTKGPAEKLLPPLPQSPCSHTHLKHLPRPRVGAARPAPLLPRCGGGGGGGGGSSAGAGARAGRPPRCYRSMASSPCAVASCILGA